MSGGSPRLRYAWTRRTGGTASTTAWTIDVAAIVAPVGHVATTETRRSTGAPSRGAPGTSVAASRRPRVPSARVSGNAGVAAPSTVVAAATTVVPGATSASSPGCAIAIDASSKAGATPHAAGSRGGGSTSDSSPARPKRSWAMTVTAPVAAASVTGMTWVQACRATTGAVAITVPPGSTMSTRSSGAQLVTVTSTSTTE